MVVVVVWRKEDLRRGSALFIYLVLRICFRARGSAKTCISKRSRRW